MPCFICVTCGTSHAGADSPPRDCATCQDPRQYVGLKGQQWTTIEALAESHEIVFREEEPALVSVEMRPDFAIAQRALLVAHPDGNVLWDCVPLVDPGAVETISALGGLGAIAISHPHFYASFADWSAAFGGVPVYLHADDAPHLRRPDACVRFWSGDTQVLADGVTLVRAGGHFEGSALLHWRHGAGGKGALLTSDTVKVGWDRRSISVMRSYPNLIPVGPAAIEQVRRRLEPLPYDRVYGAWPGHHVAEDAPAVVARSLVRYLAQIRG